MSVTCTYSVSYTIWALLCFTSLLIVIKIARRRSGGSNCIVAVVVETIAVLVIVVVVVAVAVVIAVAVAVVRQ